MNRAEMELRTRRFGLAVIRAVDRLPATRSAATLGQQLLRSGTSIGANYAEAAHASSRRHFVTTLEIAQREARETAYWLALLYDAGLLPAAVLDPLRQECGELLAVLTASVRTAKQPPRTR